MIGATKYIYSTGTHYIANSGHDERGKYNSGQAGDQTGHEYELKAWYPRPWTVVLRYPMPEVGLLIAQLSAAAALNNAIGYDQYQRTTYWKELVKAGYDPSAIKVKCEADCTASTTANVKAAGHIMGIRALEELPIDTYSGNMRSRFVAAGFKALTSSKYLTGHQYLLPGDILLYEGHHAAVNITYGSKVDRQEPSSDEPRALMNGVSGSDVKELQRMLIDLGFSCGRWKDDGDFGDATEMALRQAQKQFGLVETGIADDKTVSVLRARLAALDADPAAGTVKIFGGNCYIRTEPDISGDIRGVAKEGREYPYDGETSANGWLAILYHDKRGWVSGKYGRRGA